MCCLKPPQGTAQEMTKGFMKTGQFPESQQHHMKKQHIKYVCIEQCDFDTKRMELQQ